MHVCMYVFRYINDKEIQGNDPRVKTSQTGGRSDVLAHLAIDDVTLDDNGELKAVAKNQVGVAISVANLIVKSRSLFKLFFILLLNFICVFLQLTVGLHIGYTIIGLYITQVPITISMGSCFGYGVNSLCCSVCLQLKIGPTYLP